MRWLARIAIVLLILLAAPDLPGPEAGSGIDPSWVYGVNAAAARGERFGTDIVYTYGGWAWLVLPEPYFVGWVGPLMYWVLYIAGILAILLGIQERAGSRFTGLLLAFAAGCTLFLGHSGFLIRSNAPGLGLLTLLWVAAGILWPTWWLAGLGGVWIGVLFAIKPGAWLVGMAAALPVLLMARDRGRTVLWLSGGFLLTALIALRSDLLAYAASIPDLVGGYPEAMGVAGPEWQLWLGGALVAGLLIGAAMEGSTRWLGLACVPLLLLLWKQAITRHDWVHYNLFPLQIALLTLALALRSERKKWLVGVASLALLAGLGNWKEPVSARLGALGWVGIEQRWQARSSETAAMLAGMKQNAALRWIEGRPVEAIPTETDLALSYSGGWRHRPVFQTFQAYTPGLDAHNAAWLRTHREHAVVTSTFVPDERHALWDEPQAWRELLQGWESLGTMGARSVMVAREEKLFEDPEELGRVEHPEDTPIPKTPAGSLLLLSARLKRSLPQTLRGWLLRPDPVLAELERTDGRVIRIRAVPAHLPEGVLVSPLLIDAEPAFLRDTAMPATKRIRWQLQGARLEEARWLVMRRR